MSSFFNRKKHLSGTAMGEGQTIDDLTDSQIQKHFEHDLRTATGKTGGYISMMQLTDILNSSEKFLLESRGAEPTDIARIKGDVQDKFLSKNFEKIIGTVPKLQKAMASCLVEELRSVSDKTTKDLTLIVTEKLDLVHRNFSGLIRSMRLEASFDTPEKANKFILMTAKDFPQSITLTSINISNDRRLFTVFQELRTPAAPSTSTLPFADAAALAGASAGAGSAARPGSASGSSTEASPRISPEPGISS